MLFHPFVEFPIPLFHPFPRHGIDGAKGHEIRHALLTPVRQVAAGLGAVASVRAGRDSVLGSGDRGDCLVSNQRLYSRDSEDDLMAKLICPACRRAVLPSEWQLLRGYQEKWEGGHWNVAFLIGVFIGSVISHVLVALLGGC